VTGLTLGRVFGTEVRAHWTWIFVLAFIVVVFGSELSDGTAAAWPPAAAWGTSIAMSLLVFGSVCAHELAHVKVARRNGLSNPVVVVQLLGGPYVMEVRPKTADQELRIALVGSALSFLLAAAFGLVAAVFIIGPINVDQAAYWLQAVEFVSFMASAFNVLLGVVNLVPGYPLDGARVLHALVWRRTGQESVATAAAVRVGRYVGVLLIAMGALALVFVDPALGLALVVAGWLVMGSSRGGRGPGSRPAAADAGRVRRRLPGGALRRGSSRGARLRVTRAHRDDPDPAHSAPDLASDPDRAGDGRHRGRAQVGR
jgi:Zn-dependent protease